MLAVIQCLWYSKKYNACMNKFVAVCLHVVEGGNRYVLPHRCILYPLKQASILDCFVCIAWSLFRYARFISTGNKT